MKNTNSQRAMKNLKEQAMPKEEPHLKKLLLGMITKLMKIALRT